MFVLYGEARPKTMVVLNKTMMTTVQSILKRLMIASVALLLGSYIGLSPDTVTAQSQPAQTEFDCTTVSEIPQIECEALVAIYNGTGGPGWRGSNNWLQTTTPCSWFGVRCGRGRVTSLDLGTYPSYNLVGILPSEISNLSNLIELYLYNNKLSSIPLVTSDAMIISLIFSCV